MEEVSPEKTTETTSSSSFTINPRWRNWWIRGFFTFLMIGLFVGFLYVGQMALAFMVMAIFIKCFQEIITIGHSKYQEHNLPLYRVLNWYFLFVAVFFILGSNCIHYYPEFFTVEGIPEIFATYHRLISFLLYVFGFVMFVLTLKKDYYSVQFTLFGWTHVTLFILGSQVAVILQNMFEGLFWFLLPISMVVCNDIMAYVFGFFFGKTRLIKLSPKKTWEGFIGGFVSTVIFGLVFSYLLIYFKLTCYADQEMCINLYMFKLRQYTIPIVGLQVHLYPAVIHSIPLSVFASLIAPFGGFFASGFKRAFKIKDFSDVIPGHGGIMDRMDCQMMMATFSNVYYFTFCQIPTLERALAMVLSLPQDQQNVILERLLNKPTLPPT